MFNEIQRFAKEHKQTAVRIGITLLIAFGAEKVLENGVKVPNLSGGENYAIGFPIGFPGEDGLYQLHTYTTGPCEVNI